MPTTIATLPFFNLERLTVISAANDACFTSLITLDITQKLAPSPNVRLLRHPQDQDKTRFVLSGKLSDVCAALEHLAALEQSQSWRYGGI